MDIFKLPVHPLADDFPMIPDWQLKELAEDIKENGLLHPIVIGEVDGKKMLIDGRNRLAACKLAGITPETKELNGADAIALIVSENLMRRDLTQSQKAMLRARAYPNGQQGKKTSSSKGGSTPSHNMMANARAIYNGAPDLVDDVLSGGKSVTEAYRELQQRNLASTKDTTLYDELKENAPDLAELVDAGAKLSEQWSAYQERLTAEKMNRLAELRQMKDAIQWFDNITTVQNRESVIKNLQSEDAESVFDVDRKKVISTLKVGIRSIEKLIGEIS